MPMLALLILVLLGAFSQSLAATADEIEIREPRPLGRALPEVWERFGYMITYEEAPYDETTELLTTVYPNGRRFRFPAWKPITFHLSRPGATAAQTAEERLLDNASSAFSLAQSMVAEYNSSGNPGRFSVISDGDYVHIVPDGRSRNGTKEAFQPILDTRVTLTHSDPHLCNDVVNDVVEQVNHLRSVHIVHSFPPNFLFRYYCTLEGTDIKARDALKQLLQQMGRDEGSTVRHTWTLAYDANEDLYFLTPELVQIPRPASPPPPGPSVPSAAPPVGRPAGAIFSGRPAVPATPPNGRPQ